MLGDKFNIGSLIKNAKKMQEMVEKTQGELANVEVTGEAGGGAVKVVMSAKHYAKTLEIDPEIMKEDKQIIEELIMAAFNDASKKAEEITQAKMMDASKLFGGLGGKKDDD